MTRVPFWTAECPLKEYSGAKHEMPPADLDFAFVPGCQNSGQNAEELVCSTWASSILRSVRFHPGTKTDRRRRRKKCTRVPNFRSQLAFVRCRPPEPNLKKVPRVQTSSVIQMSPVLLQPSTYIRRLRLIVYHKQQPTAALSNRSSPKNGDKNGDKISTFEHISLEGSYGPTASAGTPNCSQCLRLKCLGRYLVATAF